MILFGHQHLGIREIVNKPKFCLFDQMGLGKSLQTIKAAEELFRIGAIRKVIVVCPSAVRSVWSDPELGELARHSSTPLEVFEYRSRMRSWRRGEAPRLRWFITNYEFIRYTQRDGSRPNLDVLIEEAKNGPTLVVFDESSALGNPKSQQSKACLALRKACARVLLLNGTPMNNSPLELYGQALILDKEILGISGVTAFKARYAVMGGYVVRGRPVNVMGWKHPYVGDCCDQPPTSSMHCPPGRGIAEVQTRLAPYVLRREKKDCLDLPDKLPPVLHEVELNKETWKIYQEMKENFLAWIDDKTSFSAAQAGVRFMRLSQVCSGLVAGLTVEEPCTCGFVSACELCGGFGAVLKNVEPRFVGQEKLTAAREFIEERMAQGEKVLVWCRFRPEVEFLAAAIPGAVKLIGGQPADERAAALRLLDPRTAPEGPGVLIGTPQSGAMGLNLTGAWTAAYVSHDYSLKIRLQSMDRIYRIGQTRPVSYFDFVAVGPKGQRTVDHSILKALHAKEALALTTVKGWRDVVDVV